MVTFYLTLLFLGASVLAIQLVMSLVGMDGHHGDSHGGHGGGEDGLDLFTVRALSAAAATFGATGLGLMQWGSPGWLALPFASLVGAGSAIAVAFVLRSMGRLEQDKSFDVASTIGSSAKVALSVPGERGGEGKIHLTAHARFMELNAVTVEPAIAAGEEVYVVDTISYDTVLVSRRPLIVEDSNGQR